MRFATYLKQLQAALPQGATLYLFDADGIVYAVSKGCLRRLDPTRRAEDCAEMLRFIDSGQYTKYLIGSAATSDDNPANATFKLGFVRPHSAFTPHAHGAEHFVLSMGYASCGLYDHERAAVAHVRLIPGSMLHIPALMPHSFNNRADDPLPLVIANTGMGIDHDDYAITAAMAEERARSGDETAARLVTALRQLEAEMAVDRLHVTVSWRERIAHLLRRLAGALEGGA
ncbi:cupin domain-containing protein [Chloroflexus sp.]|uniref:cupin domain-containing protein n=1 Tax=Chloroflexus sp. TaxID=1904827 RepID=UPI002630124C|nr:cupin domain-containing protein [uncultured Chloroflexus sp.]